MDKKKIFITAANGFLGRSLLKDLRKEYEVHALVRHIPRAAEPEVTWHVWDGVHVGGWTKVLEGAYVLINLAGRSVDCRYTEKNKAAIYASRLESTDCLHAALRELERPPKIWINAASATIYRHSEDQGMTEAKGEIGTGFSVDVCRKWEAHFFKPELPGIRRVAIRTAIVLGQNGALTPMRRLVRLGLGGKMGKGKQQFSFIHIRDFCRAIRFILEHSELDGPVNLSAPEPVKNAEFMRLLRQNMHMPFGLPLPKFLLEPGAALIGTETELVLKSRYVLPEKLLNAGFEFEFPTAGKALADLLHTK